MGKIRLILGQSEPNNMYRAVGATQSISGAAIRIKRGVLENPSFELVNPQVELLKRLYASSEPEDRKHFVSLMLLQLSRTTAPIIANAIVELRSTSALREYQALGEAAAALWLGVADKLAIEHWTFTDDDLSNLTAGIRRVLPNAQNTVRENVHSLNSDFVNARAVANAMQTLSEVIDRVRYLRLAQELMQLKNPVIDVDRVVLLGRIVDLGFSEALAKSLDEIERRTTVASSGFDFKSAMDLLRTFFEEFVEEAAGILSARTKVPLPSGDKLAHFSPFKDYLRQNGLVGREEEELLQKLYNFISNQGTHKLGSSAEHFHVAKTTVIEWCMMIAGRLQG